MNFSQPILYFMVIFQGYSKVLHLNWNARILKAINRLNEFEDNPIVSSIDLLKHVDKRVMPNVLSEAGFQS